VSKVLICIQRSNHLRSTSWLVRLWMLASVFLRDATAPGGVATVNELQTKTSQDVFFSHTARAHPKRGFTVLGRHRFARLVARALPFASTEPAPLVGQPGPRRSGDAALFDDEILQISAGRAPAEIPVLPESKNFLTEMVPKFHSRF
jgi:hypothetical protein